jgi:N6-L-threonylcarbamoyladenine synthase
MPTMGKRKLILGLESSCDECSASVVVRDSSARDGDQLEVLSVATFSQIELHQPFGGVVPEVASRNHLETVNLMIDQALKEAGVSVTELDAIAVTNRPGLVGALLVGVTAAKTMSYVYDIPLLAVHHLQGHAISFMLDQKVETSGLFPALIAIVSGGHSHLVLAKEPPQEWNREWLKENLIGRSIDDAAGEAFDKTAKLMGFPYPGGVWIDKTAQQGGNPQAFEFPRALKQKSNFNFSFSGLKTAAAERIRAIEDLDSALPDLCASIQEAIVDQLTRKMFLAAKEHQCRSLILVGGVSANSRLRSKLDEESPVPVFTPKLKYCTDNGAMIAGAGHYLLEQNRSLARDERLTLNAFSSAEF